MSETKYSVSDIAKLRHAVENKWLWGSYNQQQSSNGYGGLSRCYTEQEKVASVEELVRTHMLAGHTAEDLYASEKPLPAPDGGL